MKYSREVKVGVLAIVCAGILYFGFNFLKGVNIFSPTDCYYGYFERSNGLTEQAPVYILGHKVGLVESINYDFTRTPAFVVGVTIDKGIKLPIGTEMALIADGLLGGSAIEFILPQTQSAEAYLWGDTLPTIVVPGLMANLQTGLLAKMDSLLSETNHLIATLNSEVEEGSLRATLQNIERLTDDLKNSGQDIRRLTHDQLPGIISKIDTTMSDLHTIVADVRDAEIQNTIAHLDSAINTLNQVLKSEDGTLGLLLNDTELHDNLNTALKDLDNAVLNVDSVVMSIKARPFIKKKLPRKD
jgi:phospholipid/cholesterol/gamma-HCH transport system substrate-binding protein